MLMPIPFSVAVAVGRVAAGASALDGGVVARHGAAALADAVVDALEQAVIVAARAPAHLGGTVAGAGQLAELLPCLLGMVVRLVEAELGLDGGAVDAESVKALPHPFSEGHVLLTPRLRDGEGDLDVHRGHDL